MASKWKVGDLVCLSPKMYGRATRAEYPKGVVVCFQDDVSGVGTTWANINSLMGSDLGGASPTGQGMWLHENYLERYIPNFKRCTGSGNAVDEYDGIIFDDKFFSLAYLESLV